MTDTTAEAPRRGRPPKRSEVDENSVGASSAQTADNGDWNSMDSAPKNNTYVEITEDLSADKGIKARFKPTRRFDGRKWAHTDAWVGELGNTIKFEPVGWRAF